MKTRFKSFICILTAMSMLFATIGPAAASMITTDQIKSEVQTNINRDMIFNALQRSDVQQALVLKGVDIAAAEQRVMAMTDVEVASLATDLQSLPAGAGAGGTILTVLLVLIILDIIGVTNIFSFIN